MGQWVSERKQEEIGDVKVRKDGRGKRVFEGPWTQTDVDMLLYYMSQELVDKRMKLKPFDYGEFDVKNLKLRFITEILIEKDQRIGWVYLGYWKPETSIKEGPGMMLNVRNMLLYEGIFTNHKLSKNGRMTGKSGEVYYGEFKNYVPWGLGKYYYSGGITYIGRMMNGMRNGYGVYRWPNGEVYRGGFVDEEAHGKWVWKAKNGEVFEGTMVHNKKEGIGLTSLPDHKFFFKGVYENNKKFGVGTYYWQDGRSFKGALRNNRVEGIGIYTTVRGEQIEAEYEDERFRYWWTEISEG